MRFYRDRRLLQPPTRQRSRRDDFAYQQEHVDRLRFIGRALSYGLSLDAIAQLVDDVRLWTCNDVYRLSAPSRSFDEGADRRTRRRSPSKS